MRFRAQTSCRCTLHILLIHCNPNLAFEAALLRVYVPARPTHIALSVPTRNLNVPRCHTVQFGMSFVNACTVIELFG